MLTRRDLIIGAFAYHIVNIRYSAISAKSVIEITKTEAGSLIAAPETIWAICDGGFVAYTDGVPDTLQHLAIDEHIIRVPDLIDNMELIDQQSEDDDKPRRTIDIVPDNVQYLPILKLKNDDSQMHTYCRDFPPGTILPIIRSVIEELEEAGRLL